MEEIGRRAPARGRRCGTAAGGSSSCRLGKRGNQLEDRQQRLAAQAGAIGRGHLADVDLLDPLEALDHDFHVRLDDRFAQLAELLHVLLVDDIAVLLLRDAELLQQG